ncbi:hypothetical protein [Phormidesmis sp. 146-33]
MQQPTPDVEVDIKTVLNTTYIIAPIALVVSHLYEDLTAQSGKNRSDRHSIYL